jgi:hypothetical protein
MAQTTIPGRASPAVGAVVLVLAAAVALASARPYAGCWNDGSRLATVEALVDHSTLAIDHSIFVDVPAPPHAAPYPPDETDLLESGTRDKLYVDGHYYSDKSPVPALLLAALYQLLQWATGLTAQAQPGAFCYLMAVASSGLAYVAAVWSIYRFSRVLQLPAAWQVLLTASFALTTVALPYARQVNNHILLLGVVAVLLLVLARLAEQARGGRLVAAGALAGLGYTIDLGAGPVLLVCTLALIAYRCRRVGGVALFLAGAAPWLALHHAVNYATGGTLGPANAVAAYFDWPGCPFTPDNMTGGWKHPNLSSFLLYAAELLVGKRGFLSHNLALYLAVPGLVALLWRRTAELPEVLFCCFFCGGTWLAYAANSNNLSGLCCSVRWLVPLLAPGYYGLALLLREFPARRTEFLILSGWGLILGAAMWACGPWVKHMVPAFWPLNGVALVWPVHAAALLSCAAIAVRAWRRPRPAHADARPPAAAA